MEFGLFGSGYGLLESLCECGIEPPVSTSHGVVIVQDPRSAKAYLLSDGQNIYNRVVLVCTMNVYIPASLG